MIVGLAYEAWAWTGSILLMALVRSSSAGPSGVAWRAESLRQRPARATTTGMHPAPIADRAPPAKDQGDSDEDMARYRLLERPRARGCAGNACRWRTRGRDHATVAAICADYPEHALPLVLDVTDPASVAEAVAQAEAWAGHIDVLVNNAAYGLYGAVEEVSAEEMMRLFQTNFFGVVRVVQAVLPGMRRQGSGTIINVGSIAGLVGGPGNGFYAASKFALEGLTEALWMELEPLGLRVVLLEPSSIRTDFHSRSYRRAARSVPEYEPTAGKQIATFLSLAGKQASDPNRIARLLHDILESKEPPFRLLLGNAAVDRARAKLRTVLDEIDAWESVSRSTDFDA